ncbi:MAG: efflux RND transporter periplasmic adaptor subunit [Bacteroidales bacterium]
MKKNRNKRIVIIVSSVIAVAIIALAIAKSKGYIGKPAPTTVETCKVTKGNITETITATGKIEPAVEVKLSPDVSGEIIELHVNEGDHLKKGQLVAKINPEIYRSNYERTVAGLNTSKANLANSNARLEQAKAQFINAENVYKRQKELFDKDAISLSEYETAYANYLVAKAEVNAAKETVRASEYNVLSSQAIVDEAKENLTKTSIYSPVDGTVSKLNVQQGERVAGASQFSAGTEILRIANLDDMEVIVEVSEIDIARVSLNDTAIVEIDAYPNAEIKGVVNKIAISAKSQAASTDQITNFEVKILLIPESYKQLKSEHSNFAAPLRPGMSANVTILTSNLSQILTLPIQAVTTRPQKDFGINDLTDEQKNETIECVFVVNNDSVAITKVKTGIQDSEKIHIVEGLSENQEVVTGPYKILSTTLKNGEKIKVKQSFGENEN